VLLFIVTCGHKSTLPSHSIATHATPIQWVKGVNNVFYFVESDNSDSEVRFVVVSGVIN